MIYVTGKFNKERMKPMSRNLRYILLPLLIMVLLLTAVSFAAAEMNSETATVEKVAAKAKITIQPKNQENILVGKTAKFTVKASGKKLKYQWYYKEAGSSKFVAWKKGTNLELPASL